MTDTPVRDSIAQALAAKKSKTLKQKSKKLMKKSARKSLFHTGANEISSDADSEDSDSDAIEYVDSDDSELSLDDEIIGGDFVVVRLQSVKSRFVHYIARIDSVHNDECEGNFLQKELHNLQAVTSTPIFVIREEDKASFPKTDIIRKLPPPK